MTAEAPVPVVTGPRRRWPILLAWLVATAVIVIAFRFVDWRQALREVSGANPWWLLLAIVLNGSILVIWAALWRTILPAGKEVSLRLLAEITSLTSMVLNTMPFLVGEASGMFLLARRAKLGNAAALSVLAVDQVLLGIAKICLLVLVALLVPLPDWMRKGLVGLSIAVAVMLAVLLVFAHRGRLARAAPEHPRFGFVARLVVDWAHGLEGLRSWRKFSGGLLLEFGKKTAEMAAIVAVQYAFGHPLPLGHSLLVLAALNLVTVLPVSPANLGVYEAAVFFSYRYLGLSAEQALGMALVQHLCYLLPLAGTGYVILTVQQLRRRPLHTP